jgi:hypothetical protein
MCSARSGAAQSCTSAREVYNPVASKIKSLNKKSNKLCPNFPLFFLLHALLLLIPSPIPQILSGDLTPHYEESQCCKCFL